MQFMMLMIPNVYRGSKKLDPGFVPDPKIAHGHHPGRAGGSPTRAGAGHPRAEVPAALGKGHGGGGTKAVLKVSFHMPQSSMHP